jgi:hypothetical protein
VSFAVQRAVHGFDVLRFDPRFLVKPKADSWGFWTQRLEDVYWFETRAEADVAREVTNWPSFVVTREEAEAQLIRKVLSE